jgi:hypothetical protein
MKRTLSFALLCLGLAACGVPVSQSPGPQGDATPEPTPDPEPPAPTYLAPAFFFMDSNWGFDATGDQIRSYELRASDTSVNPAVLVTIAAEEFFNGDDTASCAFLLEQATPIASTSWTDPQAVIKGFIMDPTQVSISTDCADRLDPTLWTSDPSSVIANLGYGSAITGPVSADVQTAIVQAVGQAAYDTDFAPFVLGGGTYVDTSGAIVDVHFANGFQIDPANNFKVLDDGMNADTQVLNTNVLGGTPSDTAFVVFQLFALGDGTEAGLRALLGG